MTRKELSINNFYKGYNCCQSVVLSFSDILPFDKNTLLKLSSPFGGGISRLRETCGAVSAISIVIGLLYGYSDITDDKEKTRVYKLTQDLCLEFEKEFGTFSCKEILKLDHKHDNPIPSVRNKEFYSIRPCEKCIGKAAEILEKYINATRN